MAGTQSKQKKHQEIHKPLSYEATTKHLWRANQTMASEAAHKNAIRKCRNQKNTAHLYEKLGDASNPTNLGRHTLNRGRLAT
jgi:hypothetical protein